MFVQVTPELHETIQRVLLVIIMYDQITHVIIQDLQHAITIQEIEVLLQRDLLEITIQELQEVQTEILQELHKIEVNKEELFLKDLIVLHKETLQVLERELPELEVNI